MVHFFTVIYRTHSILIPFKELFNYGARGRRLNNYIEVVKSLCRIFRGRWG